MSTILLQVSPLRSDGARLDAYLRSVLVVALSSANRSDDRGSHDTSRPALTKTLLRSPSFDREDSMHDAIQNALCIPELLDVIVANLEKSDQARSARVCSTFWHASVGYIWTDVRAFEPLLDLVLYDNEKGSPCSDLEAGKKLTGPSECCRFHQHSFFIKHLTVSVQDKVAVKAFVQLFTLRVLPSTTIASHLPNLRTLDFRFRKTLQKPQQYLTYLLGPHLQGLSLHNPVGFPGGSNVLIPFLRTLSTQKLQLTTLCLDLVGLPFNSSDLISQFLLTQSALRRFEMRVHRQWSDNVMVAAGWLGELKEMKVSGVTAAAEDEPLPSDGFRSLVELNVSGTVDGVTGIVSRVSSPHLSDLTIIGTESKTRPLLKDIHRFNCLGRILLVFRDLVIAWDDIEPLLSCACVTEMAVYAPASISDLTDANLRAMARAWPNLSRLSIVSDSSALYEPIATLQGLQCFARSCPSLTTLWVSVNISCIPSDIEVEPMRRLEDLDLVWSVLAEREETAASFVCRLAPNLRTGRSCGVDMKESKTPDKWKRVWKLVEQGLPESFQLDEPPRLPDPFGKL